MSYGVGMIFTIANALNEPFGFDIQDIKLNRVSAEMAESVLLSYTNTKTIPSDLIDPLHETPDFLNELMSPKLSPNMASSNSPRYLSSVLSSLQRFFRKSFDLSVFLPLAFFILWCAFITLITWRLRSKSEDSNLPSWLWNVYIPLDSSVTSLVSLGVFLIFGFWMNDAYNRYWQSIQIWNTEIRPRIEFIALQFAVSFSRGLWHQRDRERIFGHIIALPYVSKAVLRTAPQERPDLSELEEMLSAKDISAIEESSDPVGHVFQVLYAYYSSVDSTDITVCPSPPALGPTTYQLLYTLWALEGSFYSCRTIQIYPISESFTLHLRLFTIFWLMLLPLSLVNSYGFISFLFVVFIGFSIINLLRIGAELADPFGFDVHDIPLDDLCDEFNFSLQTIYRNTSKDLSSYVRKSEYSREAFVPFKASTRSEERNRELSSEDLSEQLRVAPSPIVLMRAILKSFPSVEWTAQVAAVIWSTIAVFVSWGLSKLDEMDSLQENCRWWCSPIDVLGHVQSNIGFALFMILAFRASDAINRYQDGCAVVYDIDVKLRTIAAELLQSFPDGAYHVGDKERLLAHIVQIPLCFRDMLLGPDHTSGESVETLLSDEDLKLYQNSESPMDHLFQTLLVYMIVQDVTYREEVMDSTTHELDKPGYANTFARLHAVKKDISQAMSVRRFPVVGSYRKHQHMFTALWLILLPFSMTAESGFLTILWSSLVSYGVLSLESIAIKLEDPYGHDSIDIPLKKLCIDAVNSILDAAHSSSWSVHPLSQPSPIDTEPGLGASLEGKYVYPKYNLARIEDRESDLSSNEQEDVSFFEGPFKPMTKLSLFSHLLQSVPWAELLGVAVWSLIACVLSYLSRTEVDDDPVTPPQWWKSFVSMSGSVATYVSFPTFTLLGFFVNSAYARYQEAGTVWGKDLYESCHCLAMEFLSLLPRDSIHIGDHDRVIGHIAALPLVLKAELRDNRDIREVKGLLSHSDVARIMCAESMSSYCLAVVDSYRKRVGIESSSIKNQDWIGLGMRIAFTKQAIYSAHKAVSSAIFLKTFDIAPGLVVLLNMLLGLWFLVLPFVLAENNGWLTILWMPLIAYGVLGMYHVAKELQNPFGQDLNDLDLDNIANDIVRDVLFVRKNQKNGWKSLIRISESPPLWTSSETHVRRTASAIQIHVKRSMIGRWLEATKVALGAVSPIVLAVAVVWSAIAVALAYLVHRLFPLWRASENCIWFCSPIAIDGNVSGYVGFALFLLLGFRLYDSHYRYVAASKLWEEGVIGTARIVTNRLFEGYDSGTWHVGDLERLCGHMAAFGICLMGDLRNRQYEEKLMEVLSPEDVRLVLTARERVNYCSDIIFSYLIAGDEMVSRTDAVHPCGCNEHWALFYYVRMLDIFGLECKRMVRVRQPYGYVQHLRIFLAIWLFLLPLGLVEYTGWVTPLWVLFIAYGVLGIEGWAEQLSDPFGFDVSDVPLDSLSAKLTDTTKTNLLLYKHGLGSFICEDRKSLPGLPILEESNKDEHSQQRTSSTTNTPETIVDP